MKKLITKMLIACLVSVAQGQQTQTCAIWNWNNKINGDMVNSSGHWSAPGHGLTTFFYQSCTYSGYFPLSPCAVSCRDDGNAYAKTFEDGTSLINPFVHHKVGSNGIVGTAATPSGSVSCNAAEAVAVVSCSVISTNCSATVSIAVGGVGFIFPPDNIFALSHPDTTSCPSEYAPNLQTPILIDTDGKGFHLTNAFDGVPFNFWGTGPMQISWTAPETTNGWLVLPQADGMVHTGKDMFGNADGFANGFDKLASFDENRDGKIDVQDAVWSSLKIWIDTNHNGISEPEELHPVSEYVESISLKYHLSKRVDDNGNAFRYRGTLVPAYPGVDPVVVDVILNTSL